MKRKISGLLVFFIAAFICSCSLKGSTGAGKDGAAGEQGQEGGAAEDGASGERVADRIAEQAGQGLKPLICKETDRKNRRIGAQIPESGISGSTD